MCKTCEFIFATSHVKVTFENQWTVTQWLIKREIQMVLIDTEKAVYTFKAVTSSPQTRNATEIPPF